jgi:hypothetical protein
MRTVFGVIRGLLGISVAAFIAVMIWSTFPIGDGKVSIEPMDKLFTRSIPTPAQD